MTDPITTPATLTEEAALAIGVEAWIFLVPLVLMELTRRVMGNVTQPDSRTMRSPCGTYAHACSYPDANFRDFVRPNVDTLYSMLWYDVSVEPLVLTLPNSPERYHVLPLMDMWTDVFTSLGTYASGGHGGTAAIVGPDWKGRVPEGMRVVSSPTSAGWILGRIQTNGPSDFDQVRALQSQLTATPLSAWGTPAAPLQTHTVDPTIDMVTPPVDQMMALEAAEFFALAAHLMKLHRPHPSDGAIVLRLAQLGLVIGQDFQLDKMPASVQNALRRAVPEAQKRMLTRGMARRLHRDGWMSPAVLGVYGNEYLSRALTSFRGLGALPPTEAIYPTALTDSEGRPLHGAYRYRLHFDKNRIPPAHAFWSLTVYGADHFLVTNPINRYAIGDRDAMKFNTDGSLDVHIQRDQPERDCLQNWLPAPATEFCMNLRLYVPSQDAIDGVWNPPPVERLD